MSKTLTEGDGVTWRWGNGLATGTVTEVSPERTQIVSKNKLITRNGTPENPAVIITQDDGTEVIKLASELH